MKARAAEALLKELLKIPFTVAFIVKVCISIQYEWAEPQCNIATKLLINRCGGGIRVEGGKWHVAKI